MRAKAIRTVCNWAAGAALLVAFGYSILALSAGSVYASSCDCTEANSDAFEYCLNHFGQEPTNFTCPIGSLARFYCTDGIVEEGPYSVPCD
jgi:hypothetical protein